MRPFHPILPRSKAGWIVLPTLMSCVACFAPAAAESEKPEPLTQPPLRGEAAHRGYLGVTVTEICPEVRAQTTLKAGEGLMIGRVDPESPAAALGLQHYDILTRFNDQWLMTPAQFATLVENAGPEAEAEITYLRRGVDTRIKVRLGRSPARPLTTEAFPPLPEEMLSMVIRALRDNPALLENIHRLLHGSLSFSAAGGIKPGTKVTKLDDHGLLEIITMGSDQQLRAWDRSGKLIFEGPCHTAEQLMAMPEELRARVQALLKECKATSRKVPSADPAKQDPPATVLPQGKDGEAP